MISFEIVIKKIPKSAQLIFSSASNFWRWYLFLRNDIQWEIDHWNQHRYGDKMRCNCSYPDSKINGANMGQTWVLSAPDGRHVGPMNLAIGVVPWRQLNTQVANICIRQNVITFKQYTNYICINHFPCNRTTGGFIVFNQKHVKTGLFRPFKVAWVETQIMKPTSTETQRSSG